MFFKIKKIKIFLKIKDTHFQVSMTHIYHSFRNQTGLQPTIVMQFYFILLLLLSKRDPDPEMKMTSENVNLHITLKSSAVKGPPIYGETTVTRS